MARKNRTSPWPLFALFMLVCAAGVLALIALSYLPAPIPANPGQPQRPAPPQDSPDIAALPGLNPADITVSLEERGFQCGQAQHHEGDYYSWACTENTATHRYEVNIYSDRLGQVDYISASALRYDGDAGAAAQFLGFIASAPYDGAQPGEARRWVEGRINAGEARSATFGGVPFGLHGEQGKTLTIGVFKW